MTKSALQGQQRIGGGDDGGSCPSCTAFLDQLDGAAEHASQCINLAVAAKTPIGRLATFAAERGWRRLRLLSSAGTTYNRDYLAEAPDGTQKAMLNVFHRDGQAIRHFWGSELFYAPADPRAGPAPCRHPRAVVEPVRSHPGGPRSRLV